MSYLIPYESEAIATARDREIAIEHFGGLDGKTTAIFATITYEGQAGLLVPDDPLTIEDFEAVFTEQEWSRKITIGLGL
jgi:hypothetical protein